MAMVVSVQPSEETLVRFVQRPNEPPSVVITDGSTTVWFCSHDGSADAAWAAEFASRLIKAAGHWLQACQDSASPARQRPYVPEVR